jgi:hypothetical protein
MGYAEAIETRQRIVAYLRSKDGQAYLRELVGDGSLVPGEDSGNHFTAVGGLAQGELYAVEGQARALLDVAAGSLPLEHSVTPDLLPSSLGVVWLDRPIVTRFTQLGFDVPIRLISWNISVGEGETRGMLGALGRVKLFGDPPAPGWATNIIIGCWCEGNTKDGIRRPPLLYFSCSIEPNSSIRALQEIDPDTSFLEGLRFIVAFWRFVQQRILIAPKRHADRATARRLARQDVLVESTVRVVVLRHAEREPVGAVADRDMPEWHFRWLVRGHWRNQYFPASATHKPIWINPHMKGPDDKPFKAPRATVYEVVR